MAISWLRLAPPGEEQVGDVGAGDDQHDAGDREEQDERRAGLAVKRALAAPPRLEDDLLGPEQGHPRLAQSFLEGRLDLVEDRSVGAVDSGRGALERDPGREAGKDVSPVGAPVLEVLRGEVGLEGAAHRERDEDVRLRAEGGAVEAARCHADDGDELAVDHDRRVQDPGIGTELATPEAVRDDRHRVLPGDLVVGGRDQAPQGGS
jgi:hypothetical protein